MKIVVLGSGTSHGIPVVACNCKVCTSNDSRDKRMRSSLYIEGPGGEKVLIDMGPEFRLQAVRAGINRLDAIFLTHAHADHINGLDDVRPLSRNNPIPVYGNSLTIAEMKERFSYIWKDTQYGGGKPQLTPYALDMSAPPGQVMIGSLEFRPLPVKHGILDILGWEVWEKIPWEKIPREKPLREKFPQGETGKGFLYLTDTSAVPAATMEYLSSNNSRQYSVIVIGGLRVRPHETHFTFEQALDAALNIGAERIYLTHICHEHSHAEIEKICRDYLKRQQLEVQRQKKLTIHPAWDGLELFL